ncbi:MAG: hypothetical protein WCT08_01555 [Patescibacteria group bacterium]|jgi:aromatic ring-opening dioxygenase LigB subunit
MGIILSALVPHSPLLLPTIHESKKKALTELSSAFKNLAEILHSQKVDIIICFNPHATSVGNVYTFNLAKVYKANFAEFGDLTTSTQAFGSPIFTYHLKELMESTWPVSTIIKEEINYGAGIPILHLNNLLNEVKWSLISTRKASLREHFDFGIKLQKELINSNFRIAVIASGDVVTGITEASPEGVLPDAQIFYNNWNNAFNNNSLKEFLFSLDQKTIAKVMSCGAYSLAQMLGTINSLNTKVETLYNKAPFGIGYQLSIWQPQ